MTLGLVSLQEGLRLTQRATTRRRRGLGGVPGTTVPQGGRREPALFGFRSNGLLNTNVGRDHPPPLPHGHGPSVENASLFGLVQAFPSLRKKGINERQLKIGVRLLPEL